MISHANQTDVEEVDAVRRESLPIVPLGKLGKTYYFLTQLGEMMPMHFGELSERGLCHLFYGRLEWMLEQFPVYDREGNRLPGAIDYKSVAAWLIRECAAAGLFDPATSERSDAPQ